MRQATILTAIARVLALAGAVAPALADEATLKGKVQDQTGQQVIGAEVRVYGKEGAENEGRKELGFCKTDAGGCFLIGGLPAGVDLSLRYRKDGLEPDPRTMDITLRRGEAAIDLSLSDPMAPDALAQKVIRDAGWARTGNQVARLESALAGLQVYRFREDARRQLWTSLEKAGVGDLARLQAWCSRQTLLDQALHGTAAESAGVWAQMGVVAEAEDIPGMCRARLRSDTDEEGRRADEAILKVWRRTPDGEKAKWRDPIAAEVARASEPIRVAALPLLGCLGGDKALQLATAAARSENTEYQKAGILALSNWPTGEASDTLLRLARGPSSPLRVLALRGYMRSIEKLPPSAWAGAIREATPLLTSPEEKKAALAAIGSVQSPEALKLVLPFLDDSAVKTEAAQAVLAIVAKIGATHKLEAVEALQKVQAAFPEGDFHLITEQRLKGMR